MLGRLDEEIRTVRRRLEERHHLRNCMREAVNDIRRYRRRVKVAEQEASAVAVSAIDEIHARLRLPVEQAVLDDVLLERDALREDVERDVAIESRWSELVVERETRLAPLPQPLLDRLGEVEERQGVLRAQMLVAERVCAAGAEAHARLADLRDVFESPGEPDPVIAAIAAAQTRLLTFRREVKNLNTETHRVEAELAALLSFSDSLLQAIARERGLGLPARESLAVVDEMGLTVETLVDDASRFLESKRRKVELLSAQREPLSIPA